MENNMLTSDLFDIKGKVAIVTGSSRGIGFVLAQGLARAGCKIILNGTNVERVNEAAELMRKEGCIASSSVFDVTDELVVNEQVRLIEQEFGRIDILVNNAGINIRKPLEDFTLLEWQRILDINLTGAFLVTSAAIKGMIKRRAGKIINICSVQSELARPTITPYTTSKGGLRNLTRGMATDWGKYNIQINGISPGYFKTEMTQALANDEKFDLWLKDRTPAHRWGEPEELVGALLFLSSKASDFVNGQLIYVDGGLTCCV
jgi:gluconate 5-dehydrogenase